MAEAQRIGRSDLKFVKTIGEGGFSTVFEMIWEENNNRTVAVKRLNEVDKREVDILLTLQHTNIVQLLGVVEEEMDYMLVLEYCDGGSLRSYLDEHVNEPLTPQLFYDWAEQAAKPVKYLKQMHIIHKDIKSSNYMISKNNILKLADFGSAKKIEFTIKNATGTATFAYMAPELAKENILSPSYDIFALAVVLWELWTRQIPFEGRENMNIMYVLCIEDQRLPIPSDCPKILTDLMEQCWVSKREDRPSIDDILSTLKKARTLAFHVQQSSGIDDLSGLSLGCDGGEEIHEDKSELLDSSVSELDARVVESGFIPLPKGNILN